VGLLDSFERGLERAVNGAFARTFRSGVQPVEIAAALRRELDTKAAVVSRDRILAPNTLLVTLSTEDAERMRAIGSALHSELVGIVQAHARKQGYTFPGQVSVTIHQDSSVATGTVRVESQTLQETDVAWQAVVEIAGQRHTLTKARTVIGRGSDADITIADAGTSRKHVEILWDGERAMMRDLGSTNGSRLNGQKVSQGQLQPGSTITIGRTDIVFQVIAQRSPGRPTHSTRIFDAGSFDG